jgi:hypothetical protein
MLLPFLLFVLILLPFLLFIFMLLPDLPAFDDLALVVDNVVGVAGVKYEEVTVSGIVVIVDVAVAV